MTFNLNQIKTVLNEKGYQFFNDDLNIIGVRKNTSQSNTFDDWLFLIYKAENANTLMYEFPITTDPGKYWLKNPINVNGTAILVPNQYKDSHTIGLHQGKYEALTQQKPLKVWRDNNKDLTLDGTGNTYEGIFGINIHRSNAKTASSIVEKWSAGCQVFKRVKDFNFFMEICKKSGQQSFTYTLLEEKDF